MTNKYVDLVLSALAAALLAGGAVATTTHEIWPIAVASAMGLATAITQHLRQLPRDTWTEEERAAKVEKEIPK